jgi:uncharacterized protein YlxW (UPF0749 family)
LSTAVAERVEISREEYEQLMKAAPKQTVTVDATEYAELTAAKAGHDKLKEANERLNMRLRDLETALKREQRDHQEEYNELLKRVKQLGG